MDRTREALLALGGQEMADMGDNEATVRVTRWVAGAAAVAVMTLVLSIAAYKMSANYWEKQSMAAALKYCQMYDSAARQLVWAPCR
jgi:hypothetical protein